MVAGSTSVTGILSPLEGEGVVGHGRWKTEVVVRELLETEG